MIVDRVVAIDVGGTTIKGAVVDRRGAFLRELARPTPVDRGPDAIIAELHVLIAELLAGARDTVGGVGVVVPGIVDAAAGRAEFSANLGFRGVPLRDLVAKATGLPAFLDHDVQAAGVAELTIGITADVEDYLLVVIGTGIAGVVRACGQQVRGATGVAGELGHVPVWPGGEPCTCGQRGCLERYASAASVARRYTLASGEPGVSAREVVARAGAGDPTAGRVWHEAMEALVITLAAYTMMLDPAVIVLAGGLSDAGNAILRPVRDELAKRVKWREPPAVELSPLGGRAGIVGAAVVTWQALGARDFGSWRATWSRPT